MKERKNGYIYYDIHQKTEKEEIAETAWRSVFRWLYAIVGILFVFFLMWTLFFHIVSVDGNSMQPTLEDNDTLFVYTFRYQPKAGDIVVISPVSDDGMTMVKRIIATENQIVDVDYKTGTVLVDGIPLEESYIASMTKKSANEMAYPYTVPAGCVFVMGDNRDDSYDSRNQSVGSIDERQIIGKALFRLYPFSDGSLYE